MQSERIYEQVSRDINNLLSLGYGMTDFEVSIATSPNQVYSAAKQLPKVTFWYFNSNEDCKKIYNLVCNNFKLTSIDNLPGQYLYILLTSWD